MRIRGEVQSPKVYIDATKFELGVTYVNVPVKRAIKVTNLSNLPAPFAWKKVGAAAAKYEAAFDDPEGTLQPKETRVVTFTYTALQAVSVGAWFACEVEGMKQPLGFFLKTVSKGLSVEYLLASPDDSEQSLAPEAPVDGVAPAQRARAPLPVLNFGDRVPLFERTKLRLCLRNNSGTPTTFSTHVKCFPAQGLPASLGGKRSPPKSSTLALEGTLSSYAQKSLTSAGGKLKERVQRAVEESGLGAKALSQMLRKHQVVKGGRRGVSVVDFTRILQSFSYPIDDVDVNSLCSMLFSKETGLVDHKAFVGFAFKALPRISDRHESTDVFASRAGREKTMREIRLEEDRMVLGVGGGAAFLCTKPTGNLAPWSCAIIDVVCFNNMPGQVRDELVVAIEGLPPARLPLKASVVGIPLEIVPSTLGMRASQGMLEWPATVHSTEPVRRPLRVSNHGPVDALLTWAVQSDRPDGADLVEFKIAVDVVEQDKKGKKGGAVAVRASIAPHRELGEAPPFEVTPQTLVVPARGKGEFSVHFTPMDEQGSARAKMVASAQWIDGVDKAPSRMSASTFASPAPSPAPSLSMGSALPSPSVGSIATSLSSQSTSWEPIRRCLALSLDAWTVEPELFSEKNAREDGFRYITFRASAASPRASKTFTAVNKIGASLDCFVRIVGDDAFSMVDARCSNPGCSFTLRELAAIGRGPGAPSLDPNVDPVFKVPAGDDVTVSLVFAPQPGTGELDVNMRLRKRYRGELQFWYANGVCQKTKLEGVLDCPMLAAAPPELFHGTVHVEKYSEKTLHLANPTELPAQWRIEHDPANDDLSDAFVDDADCWQFERLEGVVPPTLPLTSAAACPPQGLDQNGRRKPVPVKVRFLPRKNAKYRSRFTFRVEHGESFTVLLYGRGTYEEAALHAAVL